MDVLLSFGLLILFIWGMVRLYNYTDNNSSKADDLNFNRVEYELDEMLNKAVEVRILENMISDIEICKTGVLHKGFTLSWTNEATGQGHTHQFFITDSESEIANALKKAAEIECYRLRSLLQNDIDEMPMRSRKRLPKIVDVNLFLRRKRSNSTYFDGRNRLPKKVDEAENNDSEVSALWKI